MSAGASPVPHANSGSPEAVCPFCRGDVKADLLTYGGHCPHCLIEIPGEEAPTNPNAEKVQEEKLIKEVAQVKQEKKSRLALVAFALAAVGALVVVIWPSPKPSEFALEDDWVIMPVSKHRDIADPAVTDAAPAAAEGGAASKSKPGRKSSNGEKSSPPEASAQASGQGSSGRGATATSAPPEQRGSTVSAGAATGDPFAVNSGGPSAKEMEGTCLKDEGDIETMVRGRVKSSGAQVQACYEQALKQNESLRGSWRVSLTLGRDGRASKVQVLAQNGKDAGFESCLGRVVGGWKFQGVCEDMALTVPFSFGAK